MSRPHTLFDLKTLPRCSAHARSTGQPCRRYGTLKNGRCKLHGGRATGAKTTQGLRKARRGHWKHGYESHPAKLLRRTLRLCVRLAKAECVRPGQYVPVLARDPERYAEAVGKAQALKEELERERARIRGRR